MLARAPHEKLVVLVTEGARLDFVRSISNANDTPFWTAVATSSLTGELVASGDVRSFDSVVAKIVGHESASMTLTGDGGTPLWSVLARSARASIIVGVMGTDSSQTNGAAIVLPGPNPAKGFLGSNLGLTTNIDRLARGDAPWPYSVAAAELTAARAEVSIGGTSSWVELSAPDESSRRSRSGLARVYALDEETVYVTPVYTRYAAPTVSNSEPYVADDPSVVVVSSRAEEVLPRHASDLARTRVALATELAAERRWDLLVYVDRQIAISDGIERGSSRDPVAQHSVVSPTASSAKEAYIDVDRSMSDILAVAGASAVVLVVGVHDEPTQAEVVGWYAIASPIVAAAPLRSTVDELGATIEYLLALPHRRGAAPLSSIAAAFPTRRLGDPQSPAPLAKDFVPLSAATLRNLSDRSPGKLGAETAANATP
jgi:hypothetical protein